MALMHGKYGRIEWDASIARTQLMLAQSWNCDVSMDTAEITSMGDTFRSYIGGYLDWTATVTTLLPDDGTDISLHPGDPNGMADADAYLELYFHYDDTNDEYRMLFGQCICTGIEHGFDKDGSPTSTFSFQGVSVLAWDSESEALHSYV